ncbi:orotidine-5'-phosphate decarboxylase [Rubritalea profundi]|uniref:Orotidine-5'-phosphate decarboxylase n=1 Tax=Rubritalea profundi TaxID=1658618 RepID=A0A2S7U5R1_9BACT|nr:orotidine-5'-phosphate decarboxylase [Rubritalea profundi]PQJ29781.1 orotidine 5'-phosphate decarboxylase [Rubritalea profundi]
MRYAEKLAQRITTTGSRLCVGLDPRPDDSGGIEAIPELLKRVVGETWEQAAAFKPNMAYFEAMGIRGLEILEEMLGQMPKEVPIILDAKRSDIGETQKYYARSYFENWNVDAVTLNPFLGYDTMEPFLDFEGKAIYILAVTSNPGSADFQRQMVGDRYVFELVQDICQRAKDENRKTDVGMVVGLTNASDDVLSRIKDFPLLIPGLGAQGGDLENMAGKGRTAPDTINVSRGIMYKEMEKSYAQKAKEWADQISAAYPA